MRFPPVTVIDCGASRVTAAAYQATPEGVPILHGVHVEPLDGDLTDDAAWVAAFGDALQRLRKHMQPKGRIDLLLPGHLTLTKYLRVPHVDESKREKIVSFEARQNIPYALEEVIWDYQIVSDDGMDFEVALCAVKNGIVEGLLSECRRAGFMPTVVEPACMAQINAFRFCAREARQSTLLINIGARSSNLLFAHEDRYFVRSITYAGMAFTQAMADDLARSFVDADRLKLEIGRRGTELVAPESVAAFERARNGFAARMALEVTRSVANYKRQSGVDSPTQVLLTGGGSNIPGLAAALEERLKIPVADYDPLAGISFATGAVEGEFVAQRHIIGETVGAALRLYAQGWTEFDLLPQYIRRGRAFRRREPYLIGAAALLVGALAIPTVTSLVTTAAYREKLASINLQLKPLRQYADTLGKTSGQIDTIGKQIAGIQGLVETKSNWTSFFTDLQERLVKIEDVWLEDLEVLRPQGAVSSALASSLFSGLVQKPANAPSAESQLLRLHLSGRLLDKNNPLSKVSAESQERVKTLLASFRESAFIRDVENERFDNSLPGILRFDFILVVDPQHPL